MNPRFLRYYSQELQHLREVGGEFAQDFPKIAGRLGLDAFECADSPHAIDAELLGETPLDAFAFTGHSSTEQSAWFVTIRER